MTAASTSRLDRPALAWLFRGRDYCSARPLRHRLRVARFWLAWRWHRLTLAAYGPTHYGTLLSTAMAKRLRNALAATRPVEVQVKQMNASIQRHTDKMRASINGLTAAIQRMLSQCRQATAESRAFRAATSVPKRKRPYLVH